MAANVKIKANSSDFQKQMKQMTQELKMVSSNFSVANTQAKLFGNGTDLLKSKQSELTSKMKIQNNMIESQTNYIKKLNADIDKEKNKRNELASKIDATTKKYKESVEATGKNSKESKELAKELRGLKEEYAKNDKAIENNVSKLNNAEMKLNNSKKALLENKKALQEVNKELEKSKLDKFAEGCGRIGEKVGNLGNKLTMGLTLPIGAAGAASFNLASDLNENLNKTEVVFEENSQAVEDWSKNALKNMGMCQSSALEMASKFGDMGKSMGLNSNQVKDYSTGLTQLAGDLASFKNISIEQANTALTGVYTGETEALKGLGIVMTQTNLQEFARSQGIKKKIQDMTQAEQVQLRYNYVMAKTKDSQGDFSRTSDQAANASRTFKESTKELGATIGNNLLPIFTPWINKANEIIKSFASMSAGTQKLIVGLGLFAIATGPILKVSGSILKLTQNTINGAKKLRDFAKATKEGTSGLAKFSKSVAGGVKSVLNFTKAIIINTAQAIKNGAIWVANKAKLIAFKTAQLAVTGATKAMTLAQKGLNIVMAMNPIVLVIGLLVALGATFVILYNKCEWFRNGVDLVWVKITGVFIKFDDFLNGIFTRNWTESLGLLGVPLNSFLGTVGAIWNGAKGIFNGILTFLHGVFTGNWKEIFQGLGDIVKSIFGMLGGVIKAPINAAISGINWVIGKINTISFDVPSWIPGIGGSHFGINLPTIPALAEGGIVTKATMALVGEGKEHEAVIPLSKLDKLVSRSVEKVLNAKEDSKDNKQNNNIYEIIIPVDGKTIAKVVIDSMGNILNSNANSRAVVRGGGTNARFAF